jgi:hypothetical protein
MLKKFCNDDMSLSDSHECSNSPSELFRKSFITHFQVPEGVEGKPFFIAPPGDVYYKMYIGGFPVERYIMSRVFQRLTADKGFKEIKTRHRPLNRTCASVVSTTVQWLAQSCPYS